MSLRDEEDQGRECRMHISYLALIFRKNLECFCRVAVVNVEHISLSATNGYRLSSSRLTELSRYWSLVVTSRFGPERGKKNIIQQRERIFETTAAHCTKHSRSWS
ncbi:hypothetical protein HZ326_29699 [Fusarium oxysporum f. sp. albedinis]|nr:hypothetical protein HZ326_29699 [Fusarium oxysporum f. sp. albedinis]